MQARAGQRESYPPTPTTSFTQPIGMAATFDRDLAIYMEQEGRKLVEPGQYRIYAGGSCLDERVSEEVEL